ncbi:helix-turn-helix domain-containing protein [Ktedonospora formicarum]|nr:helix-turn-helix domain-containing protein [Ktedonospora formicarum]
MEEQEARDKEHDQAAKTHLVMLMQVGYPWHKAAAGLHMSRLTAYRLVQAVQTRGEVAFQDRRHGHPTKLREAVLQWLLAFCCANQEPQSHEVQVALQEQFGIHVSIGHLNLDLLNGYFIFLGDGSELSE